MSGVFEIRAGEYEIGNDSIPNASPRHRRKLGRSIWIDTQPVSWAHFEVFVVAGGFRRQDLWSVCPRTYGDVLSISVDQRCRQILDGAEPFRRGFLAAGELSLNQPITNLTWFEAQAIARFYGARLPYEVEWEIAMACSGNRKPSSKNPPGNTDKDVCEPYCGILQEWTADGFSPRYWRADFSRVGVTWSESAGEMGVTVRGSSAEDVFHHVSFRFAQPPGSTHQSRSFRRVWEQLPASDVRSPRWRPR